MTASVETRSWREKLFDVREQRQMATPLEMRTDRESGHLILEGYAATFEKYDVFGGVEGGGWVEQIDRRAFQSTLAQQPDVQLLVNHEGWPLARTKSGTLELSVDNRGLKVVAKLDKSDPDVQRLLPKMRRKDMDEMSFAFRVRGQDWSTDYTQRLITEINLQKGDVSVVNYGMNPTTTAALSEAIDAIASLSADSKELVELRKHDQDRVQRAVAVLAGGGPIFRASKPGKYSDVSNFADPGFLDSQGNPAKDGNGVKRYPLNSAARVRNALSRFAQNKKRYSASQQATIMNNIKAAAKKFGIDVGGGDKKSLHHYEIVRAADGGAILVAILGDGSVQPVSSGVPAGASPQFSSPTPMGPDLRSSHTGQYGAALNPRAGTYTYQPLPAGSADPHGFPGYTKENHDQFLSGGGVFNPAGSGAPGDPGPQVGVATGYDPHNQTYGPKQMLSANDAVDKEVDPAAGGSGPSMGDAVHGDEDEQDARQDALDTFRDAGDWDGDDGLGVDGETDPAEGGSAPSMGSGAHEDESEAPNPNRAIDFNLAAALEKTIIDCYDMIGTASVADVRSALSRARRQIRDLQGKDTGASIDISRKLHDLRSEFGDPETLTVTEGLRALEKAGFADMMHENVRERRGAAAEPFPAPPGTPSP